MKSVQSTIDSRQSTIRALRLAGGFWLAGWVWKFAFFVYFLGELSFAYRVEHALFPAVFSHPAVSWGAYLLPILAGGVLLFGTRRFAVPATAIMASGAGVLCLHINAYNDATFVTSFWAGLWLVWLAANRREEQTEHVRRHGPRLALGMISLMFLGGTVGKLTPEYWSGEAVYHIYFLQKDYFVYEWLRAGLSETTLRGLATFTSRMIILVEGAAACFCLLPARRMLKPAVWVMAGIVLASTPWLVSVMASLIGIACGSLVLHKQASECDHQTGEADEANDSTVPDIGQVEPLVAGLRVSA